MIPGEIILLDWCSGKNTEKRFPNYFEGYAVDVPISIDKLLNKNFLEYGNYYEQLNALTVAKLSEILKNHKIKSKGRKNELVQRILDNDIHLSNIPKAFKLTDEGKKTLEYNEHIVSAHKDKFFPVYMAVRYKRKFPYPTRFEDLKLGVLDMKIEEYTESNMLFHLFECFKVKGNHLEVYNKEIEKRTIENVYLNYEKNELEALIAVDNQNIDESFETFVLDSVEKMSDTVKYFNKFNLDYTNSLVRYQRTTSLEFEVKKDFNMPLMSVVILMVGGIIGVSAALIKESSNKNKEIN